MIEGLYRYRGPMRWEEPAYLRARLGWGWGDGQCGASDLGPVLVVGLLREEVALWRSRFGWRR